MSQIRSKASTQGNVEILDKDTALEMEQTESDDIFLLSHKETLLSWPWMAYSVLKRYGLF